MRDRSSGGSFLSVHDPRLHFGLGEAKRVDTVEIRWPNGKTEKLMAEDGMPPLAINAITKIVEGKGVVR